MYKFFYIKKLDINRRLDNYIFSYFKNIPKSYVYSMIRKGNIRINDKISYYYYRLKNNDYISIKNLIYIKKNIYNINYKKYYNNIDSVKNNILYEDRYLLIFNKEPGITVHGGTKTTYSLIDNLRKIYYSKLELSHRLDKYTSGILLMTKNKNILYYINNLFKRNNIKKKYIILTHGIWKKKKVIVNLPIKKKEIYNGKFKYIVNNEGKKSISIFNVINYFYNMTLLKVITLTGRTHQIRVHTNYLNHPIIFDNIYGNENLDKKIIDLGLNRIFLHLYYISFIHPIYKKNIIIKSKISNDLSLFLKKQIILKN